MGCRDGLFSFEAERRGAAEVIGIDTDLSLAAMESLIPHLRSKVEMVGMSRGWAGGRSDVPDLAQSVPPRES